MRADDDAPKPQGPQYYAGPFDLPGLGRTPEAAPPAEAPGRRPPLGAGASRLDRMLRAQAQHHQGRR